MPPSLSVSVGVPPVDRHRLAQVERQRDGLAGVKVAARGRLRQSPMTVGVVVSICGPLWVRPVSDRLAALPAPSAMVRRIKIDRRRRKARACSARPPPCS